MGQPEQRLAVGEAVQASSRLCILDVDRALGQVAESRHHSASQGGIPPAWTAEPTPAV